MSVATRPVTTTDELLALPDDGMERWLIRGQVREKPMTVRNRVHSLIMARVTLHLGQWLETQAQPRGQVLCGEAGVRLQRNPDTTVGVDVVYIPADVASRSSPDTTLVDGVPVLAVEILSPSDTQEEIDEKIDTYLSAGVALVWVIDPHHRTVEIFRPSAAPEFVNVQQELTGEPHLPGFRVAVARLFG
ncbi:MAG TPA: Uma2 family endonuclease [Gemmataceae bacterium]|nr:Uma2 family endonuclease [Gemmataceae bacterium]